MAYDATLKVGADTRDAQRALGGLQSDLRSLAGIAAFGALAKGAIDLSNELVNLENKLRLVAVNGQTSSDVFKILNASAISLGTPLQDVGDLFFRIANNTRDLGMAQADQVRMTELMLKGFMATGVSVNEAKGAIVQFGQAMSAGVLRGDELNSILEQAPPIADAIANHFGVARGALKAMGEQGKISAKDVTEAILAAGDAIDSSFGTRIPTIANAMASFGAVIDSLSQKFETQTGISQTVSYAILLLADAVISVYEWFVKWKGVIGLVIQALAFILVPLRAIKLVLGAVTAGAALFAGAFTRLVTVMSSSSGIFRAVIAGLTGIASVLGVDKVADNVKELFSEDTRTMAEKYQDKLKEINERLGNTVKASTEAGKATDKLGAAQLKFNLTIEESLGKKEAMLALDQQRGKLGDVEYEVQKAIAEALLDAKKAGATLTADQRTRVGNVARENALLVEQGKAYDEIKKKREEALGAVTSALSSRDPRLAVEADYQKRRMQIEDAFIIDSTISEATYTQALTALHNQYLMDKQKSEVDAFQKRVDLMNLEKQAVLDRYAMEKKQIDFLDKYNQTVQSKKLQQQGFTMEEADSMAKDSADFAKKTEKQKAEWAIQQAGDVFSELGKYNRQAFEASKALNIANAVMNTYTGVTKALATYPPPFNFLAAGATLAFGLAQISTIRSQQYSGRAIGGSVIKDKSYVVGENGPEVFTPTGAGRITPNNQLGSSPVAVTFNITAVDARGVDQLIAERKPQIIGMIRSAMQDKGNRATV